MSLLTGLESAQAGRRAAGDDPAWTRREVLRAGAALWGATVLSRPATAAEPGWRVATFRSEITVPKGHPLCGGWIKPADVVDDRLWALGLILLGPERPIVLCTLDWCELNNAGNLTWRTALAEAVGTTPDRVAIHCVHPHNTPLADTATARIAQAVPGVPTFLDLEFFDRVVAQSAQAARGALGGAQPVTHVGLGQAEVHGVACNRRIVDESGKVVGWRGSACRDPKLVALPDGLIDPWLKTVSFWNGSQAVAALSYYATHPMSYYGDGRVTCDFASLARERVQAARPEVFQMYFTGCAGNVAAGKYNDGTPERRPQLRDRIVAGLQGAWEATQRHPLTQLAWRNVPTRFAPRQDPDYTAEVCQQVLKDGHQAPARRGHAAMKLAWLERIERPIDFTCLDLGVAQLMHLPGEPFIEYQQYAQRQREGSFVCVAGYGDGGPGYVPVAKAFGEGGYEPGVAYVGPDCEETMHRAIRQALGG